MADTENEKKVAPDAAAEDEKETAQQDAAQAAADDGAGEAQDTKIEIEDADSGSSDREAAYKEKIASLEDKLKRQMAEFENFRRRTTKEKEQMFSMGERNVAEKMLPIVDNFERGLSQIPDEEKDKAFASGMQMVYKQLVKQLEDIGVKPIEAVGKDFDPNFHNAVMQVDSEDYESGKVAQEFQKGYMYHDTVLRHSMVGVAK